MSADRTARFLVRLYPAAWRARYGAELESLIAETSGGRVPWRTCLDVARAALRERLRAAGLTPDLPPAERVRGGAVAVLSAWALFVIAGVGVQKFSEHWQSALPATARTLPGAAFDALVVGAALGSALVLVGVAAALPAAVRLLRADAVSLRRHLRAVCASTAFVVPLTVAVILVAHRLTERQRSGHDLRYGGLVLAWAVVAVACFVAWTALAVAIARRIELTHRVVRLEAILAAGTTLTMVSMTAATAVWWAALAQRAPWFLTGSARGTTNVSPLAPQLVLAQVCMLAATAAAAAGAAQAVRALRAAR